MAKERASTSTSASKGVSKEAKETKETNSNVTLITNGYRSRLREDGSRKIAKLRSNSKFTTQDELEKAWEKSISSIEDEDFVMGAGEPGIFSGRFATHITQIAQLENVWCPSTGLGLVCLGARYPQYDLGDADADIKLMLPKGAASDKEWWKFVCGLSGNSITSVMVHAIKHGHRVIMAIPGIQYFQYRPDLANLVAALTEKGEGKLLAAREHIRFVGPDLEAVVPAKLLPCVMPYDKAALDRLVPGVRSHGTRRIARLLQEVSPTPKDGRSNPIQDFEAMEAAFKDTRREPIVYETGAQDKATKKILNDDEASELVARYAAEAGNIPLRIVRMMREEGYSINSDRVTALLKKSGGTTKAKAK